MKVYLTWFTSPSHMFIDPWHRAMGLHLLMIAHQAGYDENGTAWMLGADGHALSFQELAPVLGVGIPEVRGVIKTLLSVGTLIRRKPDNAFGFPNMKKWQENPSATRMKRMRDKAKLEMSHTKESVTCDALSDAECDSHCDVQSDVTVTGDVTCKVTDRRQRLEVRVKEVKSSDVKPPPTPPGGGGCCDEPQEDPEESTIEPEVIMPDVAPVPPASRSAKPHKVARQVEHLIDFWFNLYRSRHPKSRVRPQKGSREAKKVESMVRSGFDVIELEKAIQGAFCTPHNLGFNDRGQEYLGLTVIMNGVDQVNRFIANADNPPPVPDEYLGGKKQGRIEKSLNQWWVVTEEMEKSKK